jgi:hypothetical protein
LSRMITIEQYSNNNMVHVELRCVESETTRSHGGGEATEVGEFTQKRWVDTDKLPDFVQRFMAANTVREVINL